MAIKHTVFIAYNNQVYLEKLKIALKASGYMVIGSAANSDAFFSAMSKQSPDVLIVDPLIGGSDGIGFLNEIFSELTLEKTLVVILTAMANDELITAVQTFPFAMFIAMPVSCKNVVEKLDKLVRTDLESTKLCHLLTEDRFLLEREVSEYMLMLGIMPNLKGYNYLKSCIMYCVDNYSGGVVMGQNIYKTVAEKLGVSVKNLERNMRHAIEVAWACGSMNEQNAAFGNTLSAARGKPTNKEFIALLTEKTVAASSLMEARRAE